ncbi:MAG: lipoprotein [Bacteroidales bacterium]|nr:lipoprotein [Bacteroidales bacterium]
MKKIIAVCILIATIIVVLSSCQTQVHCDAYKSHRSHSKY